MQIPIIAKGSATVKIGGNKRRHYFAGGTIQGFCQSDRRIIGNKKSFLAQGGISLHISRGILGCGNDI
jgi:hypothetical protein